MTRAGENTHLNACHTKADGGLPRTFLLLPGSDRPEMGPLGVTQRDGASDLVCSVSAVSSFTPQTFSHLICKSLGTWSWRWAETAGVEGKGEGLAPGLMASDILKEVLPYHTWQDQTNAEHCLFYAPGITPSSLHASSHLVPHNPEELTVIFLVLQQGKSQVRSFG